MGGRQRLSVARRLQIENGIMVRVSFTRNLQRHVPCPTETVSARTVREVVENVFHTNQRARGYVLDDQGGLRKHMIIFINGTPIRDRAALSDEVPDGAEVHVMQALSGG
jgi:molybdopterin synthase sulfur carrier subunit